VGWGGGGKGNRWRGSRREVRRREGYYLDWDGINKG